MNTQEHDFDVVIVGAGSGGYACALRAAQLGLSVALVEKDRVGGTCLHVGCIPTKALLHAAEVADTVRDADQFGVLATLGGVDIGGVQKYKDAAVGRLFRGLTGLIQSRGITLIEGRGELTSSETVHVGDVTLRARNVVLASGSHTRSLPGLEIDGNQVLNSDHALALDRVPTSGDRRRRGVIGCEFASMWRSFGADVTIVEALPHLLPNEDEAVSKQLERAFRRRKIALRLGTTFESAEVGAKSVAMRVRKGDSAETLDAEVIVVAVGRGPSTNGLGLAEAGVDLDRGFGVTDDRLRTSARGVYAVGDVVPGLQLAHRGFQHGIFVAEDIAGLEPTPIDETTIPRVTYSDPEVASVGLTEVEARERYGEVHAVTYDLGGNGKSQILKTQGFVKLVRIPGGPVVGVHIVGARAGELIGEAQLICGLQASPERSPRSYTRIRRRTKRLGRPSSLWRASPCMRTHEP